MGLDIVEVVLRCEEVFEIALEDWRLEQMRTVGDLFELICEQLHVPFGIDEPKPAIMTLDSLSLPANDGWTRDTVWTRLVGVVTDQLQVDPDEVTYWANFADDLKAD